MMLVSGVVVPSGALTSISDLVIVTSSPFLSLVIDIAASSLTSLPFLSINLESLENRFLSWVMFWLLPFEVE